MDLDYFDEETEVAIVEAKSGLEWSDAEKIVRIVRSLRESGVCEFAPTIRGCVMIGKTFKLQNGSMGTTSHLFGELCLDILASESTRVGSKAQSSRVKEVVSQLIEQYF